MPAWDLRFTSAEAEIRKAFFSTLEGDVPPRPRIGTSDEGKKAVYSMQAGREMASLPFVAYGILNYLRMVYVEGVGASPVDVMNTAVAPSANSK